MVDGQHEEQPAGYLATLVGTNGHEILNLDGEVVAWAVNEEWLHGSSVCSTRRTMDQRRGVGRSPAKSPKGKSFRLTNSLSRFLTFPYLP